MSKIKKTKIHKVPGRPIFFGEASSQSIQEAVDAGIETLCVMSRDDQGLPEIQGCQFLTNDPFIHHELFFKASQRQITDASFEKKPIFVCDDQGLSLVYGALVHHLMRYEFIGLKQAEKMIQSVRPDIMPDLMYMGYLKTNVVPLIKALKPKKSLLTSLANFRRSDVGASSSSVPPAFHSKPARKKSDQDVLAEQPTIVRRLAKFRLS